jgi:magnesium chelatase subunit I
MKTPKPWASSMPEEQRASAPHWWLPAPRLPHLAWSDEVLHHAAACAIAAGVDGMRADLVMLRAARALAALEGRGEVTVADVDAVAELALAHRRPEGSAAQPPANSGAQQQPQHNPERPQD